MKLQFCFKCPSAVEDAIEMTHFKSDKELEQARKLCNRFFEYGEYVYIEIDTEKETATVL